MVGKLMHRLHGKQALLLGQLLRLNPAMAAVVDQTGARVRITHHGNHISGPRALAPAASHGAANLNRNNHVELSS